MTEIKRIVKWNKTTKDVMLSKEWLITNGLGGYASGTVAGVSTRRYHGILIAALPAPLGRRVMLNHLSEKMLFPNGKIYNLASHENFPDKLNVPASGFLSEFLLDYGLPVWRFEIEDSIIERRMLMPYMQNTIIINYRLLSGSGPIRLELVPSVHFRPHEAPVNLKERGIYEINIRDSKYEISMENEIPPLRMNIAGDNSAFTSLGGNRHEIFYRHEAERGYESFGGLWSPGYFRAELSMSSDVSLIASTENWDTIFALKPNEAFSADRHRRIDLVNNAGISGTSEKIINELILSADQFIISPIGRTEDNVRLRAEGGNLRSVIAGYHWFTDWGRDTMISLEGLTLTTARYEDAYWILRTFAHYIKNGLIPNLFPEGEKEGLYHTADATLWFFHSVDKYVQYTEDESIFKHLLFSLKTIIDAHIKGTKFNIKVDPEDGLLSQGEEGYQLTWMDAKVEDWVVTPRRGKAVEINALWYNALMLMKEWLKKYEPENYEEINRLNEYSERLYNSFNEKFWYAEGGYLYDVVDAEKSGNDNALRPNQIFSISLKYPVLHEEKWKRVVDVVEENLLTTVGLRSLAKSHPDYKEKYFGNLRARDAAYHQGTVWSWLIGPFVDAWLKVHPDKKKDAYKYLNGLINHLSDGCIGSINEVFDAEEPFTPRGCIAQAWGVAEVLRCLNNIKE